MFMVHNDLTSNYFSSKQKVIRKSLEKNKEFLEALINEEIEFLRTANIEEKEMRRLYDLCLSQALQ